MLVKHKHFSLPIRCQNVRRSEHSVAWICEAQEKKTHAPPLGQLQAEPKKQQPLLLPLPLPLLPPFFSTFCVGKKGGPCRVLLGRYRLLPAALRPKREAAVGACLTVRANFCPRPEERFSLSVRFFSPYLKLLVKIQTSCWSLGGGGGGWKVNTGWNGEAKHDETVESEDLSGRE